MDGCKQQDKKEVHGSRKGRSRRGTRESRELSGTRTCHSTDLYCDMQTGGRCITGTNRAEDEGPG